MHKTLYIDIDEEITSIIDRVRKAEAREIIIVAPKNALLLQSIVNLKLLKKESDRRKKQLMIITQDKIGKKLIEKAGISVQTKPDSDLYLEEEPKEKSYEPMYAEEASEIKEELQKEEQEKEIGSSEYFDEPVDLEDIENSKKAPTETNISKTEEKKKEPVTSTTAKKEKPAKSQVRMSDIVVNEAAPKTKMSKKNPVAEKTLKKDFVLKTPESLSESYLQSNNGPSKISQVSIKKAEKFFRGSRRIKKDLEIAKVSGNTKKYFALFTGIFVLLAGSAAAYFLLPKATLALQLKNEQKTISLDITADAQMSGISTSEKIIPAKMEQAEKEITQDFDATGTKNGGGKATGKAVIYNEFSPEDQPLVATTRLETSEGKIFRLTKNTVVPGVTKIGADTKPGAIEVDVIADKPGEDYNIGPADFKIPGFQDNQAKYDKFYAKSAKSMTGGSTGETKVVTAQDIAGAKEKISVVAKKEMAAELKSSLSGGRQIFDDAVQIDVLGITSSDSAGAEKDKFTVTAKAKATALSFQESDIKELMKNSLAQGGISADSISFDQSINYILTSFDKEQKNLKFQAKTDAKTSSDLDLENFKKGILGKTAEEAQTYAKNFPGIQKMDISFWPFFVNRIPMSEGKVNVEVK